MKIVVAADSFKDALQAEEVCEAIQNGLLESDHSVNLMPLADGGEGSAAILTRHYRGHWQKTQVQDPLGRIISAGFGVHPDGHTAYIEMAAASGLMLLSQAERNPLQCSSYGTGQLIQQAIQQGATHIYLCIGGSATNDGGLGMAAALGWQFKDQQDRLLKPTGANLRHIIRIIPPDRELPAIITVLSDVTNPLLGPKGATHTYGPQKGADAVAMTQLEAGLRHLAEQMLPIAGKDYSEQAGAGAAGGLGYGALVFLKAHLMPGAQEILRLLGFSDAVAKSDLVITGEGKLDQQSQHGKLIRSIGTVCQSHNKPLLVLCGHLALDAHELQKLGITAAFSISAGPQSLAKALQYTAKDLFRTSVQLGKVLAL